MLRLASDADVHGEIIRGLRRRLPEIDLVRAQDVLPEGTPDPTVLAWAAAENRVLITNDRNTMVGFAYQRVASGESVPGLIATTTSSPSARPSTTSCSSQSTCLRTRSGNKLLSSCPSEDKGQRCRESFRPFA